MLPLQAKSDVVPELEPGADTADGVVPPRRVRREDRPREIRLDVPAHVPVLAEDFERVTEGDDADREEIPSRDVGLEMGESPSVLRRPQADVTALEPEVLDQPESPEDL